MSTIVNSADAADDSLAVTATIVDPPGGSWGTRYTVVMWMENAANTFQRTFRLLGSNINTNDVPIWNSKNGGTKTVDGVTSATLSAGATVRGVWNLNGVSGIRVPNGTYIFNIELSNHHSSTASYTDWFAQGSIVIGTSSSTKNGIDSSLNSASTYITNVSAVYTPGTSGVILPEITRQSARAPLSFNVPGNFSGMAFVRIFTPEGKMILQKSYRVSSGGELVLTRKDILPARMPASIGILEVGFGTTKISREYMINNR